MTITHFDPTAELPTGRVTLEASAGTGKTWTIAALVTRYVAEQDIPLEQILVVTFTRAATSELRDRVRSRLVEAEYALEAAIETGATPEDLLLRHIVDCDADARELRRGRLARAIRSFDDAVISTIHGFASHLLRLLGLLSRGPLGLDITGDVSSITKEVLRDLSINNFVDDATDRVDLEELGRIASAVLGNPDSDILPDNGDDRGAALRAGLAQDIRSAVGVETHRIGATTYDDLLIFARDGLADPEVGEAARSLVRRSFSIAFVDEFQDTDRIQWDIMSSIFDEHGTLLMIGDPKQAIYSFRGADVHAYLDAAGTANASHTLGTNWRSDGPLITALEAIFDGVSFGEGGITFKSVKPAPGKEAAGPDRLHPPISLRLISREAGKVNKQGHYNADAGRSVVADDVAAYVVDLLDTGLSKTDGLEPSDIAVLCRTRAQIQLVSERLTEAGVPAVIGGTGSVLLTPAASHWQALLGALDQPASPSRVRRVLLSPFGGWTADRLAAVDDDQLAVAHDQIADWAKDLRDRGVPGLLERIDREAGLSTRVLSIGGGERLLTDIHHVGEVIHRGTRNGGIRSISDWLTTEIALAEVRPEEAETRVRRLETDAQAVQLITIHSAKGLEFPIVLAPFMWLPRPNPRSVVPVVNDPVSKHRSIYAGGKNSPEFSDYKALFDAEQDHEDFRVLYVTLTRARHHLAIWWAPYRATKEATLTKVLFGRDSVGDRVDSDTPGYLLSLDRMQARLGPVLDRAKGTIDVQIVDSPPTIRRWEGRQRDQRPLAANTFAGSIDTAWWRWSYSSLSHDTDERAPEPAVTIKDDEPTDDLVPPPGDHLPLGPLRGGARFGNLVHSVLEDAAFDDPDLVEQLEPAIAEQARRAGLELDPPMVAAGLITALETPLGAHFGDHRLRDVARGHRIDEMQFEFPVRAEGTNPVALEDLAALLEQHLPVDDPLASYPDHLRSLRAKEFRGYLTGAIDLTLRLPDHAGSERWWIADYKTNRMRHLGQAPSTNDYRQGVLAETMMESHYGLQALLYQVALHRYLTLRLPDYQPATHLGGALYLFVRGMVGPDTPVLDGHRTGVFTWNANPGLVLAIDDLFKGDQ